MSAFDDICIYYRNFSLFLIMEENTTNPDQTTLLCEVMYEVKSGLILILMSRQSRVDCIMDRRETLKRDWQILSKFERTLHIR